MAQANFKAVIFDFGGVITASPFEAFNRLEAERGLPENFIRTVNATNPDSNAWALFERAEIDAARFDALFAAEAEALGHALDGASVLSVLSGSIRPAMVSALVMALALGLAAFRRIGTPVHDNDVKGRAFHLGQSIGLALLLSGMTAVVTWVQGAFGTLATLAATALAGFADMHSVSAAAITLAANGGTDAATMLTAVLLAFSTNSVSKIVAAYAAGGMRFGSVVSMGLLLVALAAWLPWGWARWLA